MIRLRTFPLAVVVLGFVLFAPHVQAAELLGHWTLDETTQGSTVTDTGAGANNGTPSGTGGGPSHSTNIPSVNFSDPGSYYFNGIDQYVQISSGFRSGMSVTFWFKPEANGSGGGNDNWYSGSGLFDAEIAGVTYDFGVTWSANHVEFGTGAPDTTIRSGALALDTWYQVSATWQASDGAMKLYINGTLVSSTTGSTHDRISTGVRFGELLSGANTPFKGYMDDIRTYDVALDSTQVTSLASGNSLSDFTPITFSPADDATNVVTSTNFVLTIGTSTVATSTGAVGLYKTSDNSLVESFGLSSSALVRSQSVASTTFTITPSMALAENTGYYLSIASTTFQYGTGTFYAGTTASTTWNFTTGDFTAPLLSVISATSTASTTASITWTSNENASTKVAYGLTTSYGTDISETDTSPRVTAHTKGLSSLLGCTTYHYVVVSRDAALNAATSTDNSFTTIGCTASSTPTAATSTSITSSSGGSTSLTDSGKTLTVSLPANATATSSSVVIQVQAIAKTPVITELGTPAAAPNTVGGTVFDVKAIINGNTILDSFDHPVTISYAYTDSEISGLDESTLKLYHYHDGAWVALSGCSVDQTANTITCTTPSFSIFGLFGSSLSSNTGSGSSGGGTLPWCSGPSAPGWNSSVPGGGCGTIAPATPVSNEVTSAKLCPYYHFTRQLRFGDKGEDVRALQKFLNCAGFLLGSSGPGSPGNETSNFSDRTLQSVKTYQAAYSSAILAPIETTTPTGIFATYSQKKAYSLMLPQ